MGNWSDYTYEERKPVNKLVEGKYRAVVISAEEGKSSKGNDMITVSFKVSGSDITIKDFFVKNEWFDGNISRFFDSFTEIAVGNFNFIEWKGAIGAVYLKEDDRGYLKIKRYLPPEEAENLPDWVGEKPERQAVTKLEEVSEEQLPF